MSQDAYGADLTDHSDPEHAPGGVCVDCRPEESHGSKRIVIELNVDVLDENWSEETLLENMPFFFEAAITRAERRNQERFPDAQPFQCDVSDLTVWTREGYIADLKEEENTT